MRRGLSDSDDSDGSMAKGASAKRMKPNQLSSTSSASQTTDDEEDWNAGTKPKMLKKFTKKQRSAARDRGIISSSSDSEEDGEIPSSIKSIRSNNTGSITSHSRYASSSSASEVTSELAFDEEELKKKFTDGYDSDLQGDMNDRQRLVNMTEIDREQELYNRSERREALQKRFEIEKKLRLAKAQSTKDLKRKQKATVKLFNQAASSTTRRRKIQNNKDKSVLENFKKERERKKSKAEGNTKPKKEIMNIAGIYSDDDDEERENEKGFAMSKSRMEGRVSSSESSHSGTNDSSDSSSADESSKVDAPKSVVISSLEQLSKIIITRDSLAHYVYHPAFATMMVGCYVRVVMGNRLKPVSKIAEIYGLCETAKVYKVNASTTNLGLKLRHGKETRIIRICFVSNQKCTDIEFRKWKYAVDSARMPLPTEDLIQKKIAVMVKHKKQNLQDKDIDHMVKEKNKFRSNPYNYAVEKTNLRKVKEHAEAEGDMEKLKEVTDKLADLEGRADKLDKKRQEGIAGITYINDRIKSYNLVKEEAAKQEFQMRSENVNDPFTRRRCKPVIVSNTDDGSQTKRLIKEMDRRYGGIDPDADKNKKAEPKALTSKLQPLPHGGPEVDLHKLHDFDIDISLTMPLETGGMLSVNPRDVPSKAKRVPGRKSLNLSEYKKRRGLL